MKYKTYKNVSAISFSVNNNLYLYDRYSNAILQITDTIKEILDDYYDKDLAEIELKYKDIYSRLEIKEAYEQIDDLVKNSKYLVPFCIPKLSIDKGNQNTKLQDKLSNKLTQLIFNVTEDCNLRCKYCIYSGEYDIIRQHNSNNKISWDIAKKAIDIFLNGSVESKEKYISFYGGEPLLNFDFIKKVIKYTKNVADDVEYTITTNATLLKGGKLQFLIENNVHITISLDGPAIVQDKNRIFPNGEGTFKTVWNNIINMQDNYPDYFNNKISINCVIVPDENIKSELKDFFSYNRFPSFKEKGNFSCESVNPIENSYYTNNNYKEFINDYYQSLLDEYVKEHIKGTNSKELPLLLKSNYPNREFNFFHLRDNKPFDDFDYYWPNGICIPGMRSLFVSSNGSFFPCEKLYDINDMEIGNVKEGLNIRKINDYIESYSNSTLDICKDCWAFRLCGECFLSLRKNNENDIEFRKRHCRNIKFHWALIIQRYVAILEKNPLAFDYLTLEKNKEVYINEMIN